MGTKEVDVTPGITTMRIKYPRVKTIEDPTTPPSHKMMEMKLPTKAGAEKFKDLILLNVPDSTKHKHIEEYLDSYYELRLLHEAGIEKCPVNIEDEPSPAKAIRFFDLVDQVGLIVEPPESLETCPDCDIPFRHMHDFTDGNYIYEWLQCPSCAFSKLPRRDPKNPEEVCQLLDSQQLSKAEFKVVVDTRVCGKCEQYIPKTQKLNIYKQVGYCDRCFYGDILGKQSPPPDTDFDGNLPGMI